MELQAAKRRLIDSDLGSACTREQLAQLLFEATVVSLSAGQVLFTKGQEADQTFLLLVEGRLAVEGKADPIDASERGALLGEIGVLNPNKVRTVTVTATAPSHLLSWRFGDLPADLQSSLTPVLEKIAFERISDYTP